MAEMTEIGAESEWGIGHLRYADPYRFDCEQTARLRFVCRDFEDIRGLYVASQQRESRLAATGGPMEKLAAAARRDVEKTLKAHPVWSFLEPLPGLRGALTGLVISAIGNPHRFPGQRCSNGHYLPVGVAETGAPCPLQAIPADARIERDHRTGGEIHDTDTRSESERSCGVVGCPGVVLEPRRGTGTRSVWHYLGLTPDTKPRKGVQGDYHRQAKGYLLAPDTGLAAQIIRQRTEPYRTVYDETKLRLLTERGPETADRAYVSETSRGGLRPIQIERIARKVAVKAFTGDLLAYWKTIS